MKRITLIALLAIVMMAGCNSKPIEVDPDVAFLKTMDSINKIDSIAHAKTDIELAQEIFTNALTEAIIYGEISNSDKDMFMWHFVKHSNSNPTDAVLYAMSFDSLVMSGCKFTYDKNSNKLVPFKLK